MVPAQAVPQVFDLLRQLREPRLRRLQLGVPDGQLLQQVRDPGAQRRKLARRRDGRHAGHKSP